MKRLLFILCSFLCVLAALNANEPQLCKSLNDYLLPDDHPVKPTLDQIFSSSTVLDSLKSLTEAGFIDPQMRKSGMVLGRHPDLQGYLLKIFLNSSIKDERTNFKTRIIGARLVQDEIDKLGCQNVCKVPQKWIYKIPQITKMRKKLVLVVEDMKIKNAKENPIFYKSDCITTEHLDALFAIVTKVGLWDSLHISNIPYTDDGYIAFIDTERYGSPGSVRSRIQSFIRYLSPENALYWKNLCSEK